MNTPTLVASLVMAGVLALLIAVLIHAMMRGWRHRIERQAQMVGTMPPLPDTVGPALVPATKGLYVGSTLVPHWNDRVAAGDLGLSAARKFDCEAWVPTQGTYRELTSTSNCTTFQARRLNIRERVQKEDGSKGGTRMVATLNGTLATTRWIVAILENHQNADGSVTVPAALRQYAGLDRECTVIGTGSRVEVWDTAAWTAYLEQTEDAFAEQSEEVVPGLM